MPKLALRPDHTREVPTAHKDAIAPDVAVVDILRVDCARKLGVALQGLTTPEFVRWFVGQNGRWSQGKVDLYWRAVGASLQAMKGRHDLPVEEFNRLVSTLKLGPSPLCLQIAHRPDLTGEVPTARHDTIVQYTAAADTLRRLCARDLAVAPQDLTANDLVHWFVAQNKRWSCSTVRVYRRAAELFLDSKKTRGELSEEDFKRLLSASLIGRLGSSTFRPSTCAVSMSLTGSCFSSKSARRPFHHGIRGRGGTICYAALPSD